jgi:hypothetical protein
MTGTGDMILNTQNMLFSEGGKEMYEGRKQMKEKISCSSIKKKNSMV